MGNKQTKLNLAILLMAAAVCMAGVSWAAEMGTAFSYRGFLEYTGGGASRPEDGLFDFRFSLYDDPNIGTQLGSTIVINDYDVIEGNVEMKLDFGGDVFTGDARWLDIWVRPGASSDPCDFATLSPRQEVTPTPYALHTRGLFVDTALNNVFLGEEAGSSNTTGSFNSAVGRRALFQNTTGYRNLAMGVGALRSNTTGFRNSAIGFQAGYNNSTGNDNVFVGYKAGYNETGSDKLYIANSEVNPPLIYGEFDTGNVGIGTTTPATELDVVGTVNATAFVGDGSGLTGIAGDSDWTISGSDMYTGAGVTGNVGIGTTNPLSKLSVGGDGFLYTGVYGSGSGVGVEGEDSDTGSQGFLGFDVYGVYGSGTTGVYGNGTNGVIGVGSNAGVYGIDSDTNSWGRLGYNVYGVYGEGSNFGGYFVGDGYFSGDVGIGKTNPSTELDVVGTVNATAFVGDGSSLTGIATGDSDWTISGSDMYSGVSGNVGIGTTSPGGELHIKTGTGGGSSPLTNADRLVIESDGISYINQISATAGFGGIYFSDDVRGRGWVQYAHSTDVLSFGASGTTRLNIDSSGNVGIGTTIPQNKLDVKGAVAIGASYFGSETAPTNGMIIEGNVGIGTPSPNEKLTVEGVLSLDEIAAPSATSGYGKVYVKSTDSSLYFKDDGGIEYDLTAGEDDFVVGDFLISANDTDRGTMATGMYPLKESKIGRSGALRIKFDLRSSFPGLSVYASIWRNGVSVGTLRDTTSTSYVTFTEDISGWSKGDLIQVRAYTTNSSYAVYVSNLRLYADNPAEAGARL